VTATAAGSSSGPVGRTFRRRGLGAANRGSSPIYAPIARWSYPQPPDTIADAWEPPGSRPAAFPLGDAVAPPPKRTDPVAQEWHLSG
jgi:hypothetical protein